MMTRKHVYLQIFRYIEGELSPDERAEFERRLQTDIDLAAEVSRWRRSRELVDAWGSTALQLDWDRLATGIARACAKNDERQGRLRFVAAREVWRRYGPPLAAAAAIALVLAGRALLVDAPERSPIVVVRFGPESVGAAGAGVDPDGGGAAIARVSFARAEVGGMPAGPARPVRSMAIVAVGGGAPAGPVRTAPSWF